MTSITLYNCAVCQQPNISLLDLHYHHMQHHTSEELSLTIINLQGFQVLKKACTETECSNFKIDVCNEKSNDNNNNKCLYEALTVKNEIKNEFPSNTIFISQVDNEIEKISTHDMLECLTKCSPFITWENQLNQREQISDDDFVNVINHLCNDLAKRKCKDRKKKGKAVKDNRNLIQTNNTKKMTITNKKKSDNPNSQVSASTSSFCDNMNLNSMLDVKNSNENFNLQLRDKSDDTTSLSLNNIDANKNLVTYNPVTDTFSWSSCMILNPDIKEVSVKVEVSDSNSVF